ncbi:MAG: LysM peptidoglycan-binding domain-containing protein [Gammaproteobacteria bacterium]|nr:LysM peptidoglycan-binding domain-containing protein [Gammaproteobacteria bacterium]
MSLERGSSARSGSDRPDFSNVRGSADTAPGGGSGGGGGRGGRPDFSHVESSASTVPGDTTPTATAQVYTVQKGDTLSHIAKHHYGKASLWRAIFEANRDQIDDPDLIHPGQVLKIPPQDAGDRG